MVHDIGQAMKYHLCTENQWANQCKDNCSHEK